LPEKVKACIFLVNLKLALTKTAYNKGIASVVRFLHVKQLGGSVRHWPTEPLFCHRHAGPTVGGTGSPIGNTRFLTKRVTATGISRPGQRKAYSPTLPFVKTSPFAANRWRSHHVVGTAKAAPRPTRRRTRRNGPPATNR
jgi:hypothetical protein